MRSVRVRESECEGASFNVQVDVLHIIFLTQGPLLAGFSSDDFLNFSVCRNQGVGRWGGGTGTSAGSICSCFSIACQLGAFKQAALGSECSFFPLNPPAVFLETQPCVCSGDSHDQYVQMLNEHHFNISVTGLEGFQKEL